MVTSDFWVSQNDWGWKGHRAPARPRRLVAQINVLMVLKYLQGWRLCTLSEQSVPVLSYSHSTEVLLMYRGNLPSSRTCPLCLVLALGIALNSLTPIFFASCLQILICFYEIPPKSPFLQDEQSPFLASPNWRAATLSLTSWWPFIGTLSSTFMSVVLRTTGLNPALQVWTHWADQRGRMTS